MARATTIQPAADRARAAVYRKVSLRLLPLLFLCYMANYIDRTNVALAQVQLKADLGFSEAVYGLGVGLFFIGFILFEVPSNLLLSRIGVRRTLLRIMVCWGLVSTATMFVTTPAQFYAVRLLLGVAEAGFFPGMLLYFTYWFPSARRTAITSLFFLAIPVSVILSSPLSGWIMRSMDGVSGMHGWQWMFLIEGLPSVALGVAAYRLLDDGPASARWLSADEKALIEGDLRADQAAKAGRAHGSMRQALRDPRVYVLGLIGFGSYTLANAVSFWSPLIINASGVRNVLNIGLLAAAPPLFGAVVMLFYAAHSDRTLERRWHVAGAWLTAAGALVGLSLLNQHPVATVALLAVMSAGHYCGLSVYWSIPSIYLGSTSSAAGIALVTAIGSMGAALSPILLGWVRVQTGSLSLGLQMSAAIIAAAVVLLLVAIPARALREERAG